MDMLVVTLLTPLNGGVPLPDYTSCGTLWLHSTLSRMSSQLCFLGLDEMAKGLVNTSVTVTLVIKVVKLPCLTLLHLLPMFWSGVHQGAGDAACATE